MNKYEKQMLKVVAVAVADKIQAQPKSTYDCMCSQ